MIIIVHHQADEGSLRLGDVPDIIDAVARHVAQLGVFGPGVERLALVGPLLRAVIARHDRPIARCRGAGRSREGRPVGGALAVASGFAGRVLVEDVKRHALLVHERLAFGCIGDLGRH